MEVIANIIQEVGLLCYISTIRLYWLVLCIAHYILKVEDRRFTLLSIENDIVLLEK